MGMTQELGYPWTQKYDDLWFIFVPDTGVCRTSERRNAQNPVSGAIFVRGSINENIRLILARSSTTCHLRVLGVPLDLLGRQVDALDSRDSV